ncbi:MAG: hypothetical protein AAF438_00545, partial [Pseudomonadota bacterium]
MSDTPASSFILNALPIQPVQRDVVPQGNDIETEFGQVIQREQQVQTATALPPATVVPPTPSDQAIQAIVLEQIPALTSVAEAVAQSPLKPELGREILNQTSELVRLQEAPQTALQQLGALSNTIQEVSIQLSKTPGSVSNPLPLDGKILPETKPMTIPARSVTNPAQIETTTRPEPIAKSLLLSQPHSVDALALDPEPRTLVQQTGGLTQFSAVDVRPTVDFP